MVHVALAALVESFCACLLALIVLVELHGTVAQRQAKFAAPTCRERFGLCDAGLLEFVRVGLAVVACRFRLFIKDDCGCGQAPSRGSER